MSQSPARMARRACKRAGHVPKTDGNGAWGCERCGISLEPGRGFAVSEPMADTSSSTNIDPHDTSGRTYLQ